MAKPAEQTRKIIIEREYIVPLRREFLNVPRYKRANKAVKALKEFLARHMKIYDRDLRKIKVDILLNNEIRFRGMKKPPAKIKVNAIKYDDGTVEVKLVNIPKHIEFQIAREARREVEMAQAESGKKEEKAEAKEAVKTEDNKAQKTETKEKEESSKIETEMNEKKDANIAKHTTQTHQKDALIQRKSLKK